MRWGEPGGGTWIRVYGRTHESGARRRGEQRRAALEARYGAGMARHTAQQGATDTDAPAADLALARMVAT
jgi:hypothetical protein